jgi:trans-aconitate methyltransferase
MDAGVGLPVWGAAHYLRGRPPYSASLVDVLTDELRLDGSGVLVDVGCGPGVLTVFLAAAFDTLIGVDPDPGMLAEAARHATEHSVRDVRWINARAESLASLGLPPARLATFGQSFHWTDRRPVAEAVYDLLEPGGSVALIAHTVDGRPVPAALAEPIPHEAIREVIRRYLGSDTRAGHGRRPASTEAFADSLAATRFRVSRTVYAPGRADVIRSVDDVIDNYLSMSFAAPHLFGPHLDAFMGDVRDLLLARSADGRFWDWPGDTEITLATKPGA